MDSASVNTIGLDRQWKELALYDLCRRVGILEGCEYSVFELGRFGCYFSCSGCAKYLMLLNADADITIAAGRAKCMYLLAKAIAYRVGYPLAGGL